MGALKATSRIYRCDSQHMALWTSLQQTPFGTAPSPRTLSWGGRSGVPTAVPRSPICNSIAQVARGRGGRAFGAERNVRGGAALLHMRPRSRGSVNLRSADPAAMALVDPNFLADPDCLWLFVETVKISREIFAQASLRKNRIEHQRCRPHPRQWLDR